MSTLPPESTSESLSTEIRRLGHTLGEIIIKLEGKEIFNLEEKLRLLAKSSRAGESEADRKLRDTVQKLTPSQASRMAMAFTVYFELVNLAEETHRVRLLRQRRRAQYTVRGTPPMRESIGAALRELKAKGVPADQVQVLLDKLCIELVFTAHPTEAKRRTMLTKLQRLAQRLHDPEALVEDKVTGVGTPRALEREITSLWLTDRSRTNRPEVTDEVLTGLWYFDTTLWETVPLLQDELERALAETYPTIKAPTRWITFGSWMGGDRDGNPNVTPAVTAKTLMHHRRLALDKLNIALRDLSHLVSVSSRLDEISPELARIVDVDTSNPHVKALRDRYPFEPYRLAPRAGDGSDAGLKTSEVAGVLDIVSESLKTHRGALLADGELHRLRQQVELFGLSVARLDVRQHSGRQIGRAHVSP